MSFAGLKNAMRKLSDVPSQVAKGASVRIKARILNQFVEGTDAYGNTWAPLKSGAPSHLHASGDLEGSVDVRPKAGSGIQVSIDDVPGRYHQTGTKNMPARPILPDYGLPKEWSKDISEEYAESVRRKMK